LGHAFKNAAGKSIDEFSEEFLFSPMGIDDFTWDYINTEVVYASGELELLPRDMAKFGQLFLNDGVWNGKRILSRNWVEKTTRPHISTDGRARDGESYGYQWWQKRIDLDSTSVDSIVRTGWGGQAIILFPDLDALVVLTGGNYAGDDSVYEMITRYILPAIIE
jgi:CubicO group peptidase (beta-lactamase class C family)